MSSGKVSNPLAHFRPAVSFLDRTNPEPNGAACRRRIVPPHNQLRIRYAPWQDSNFDVKETYSERAIRPAEKIILLGGRNGLHQSLQIRISATSQRDEFSFRTLKFVSDMPSHAVGLTDVSRRLPTGCFRDLVELYDPI